MGSGLVGFVRSSKLMMNSEMSSTSDRIGAMTSEHRNFVPAGEKEKIAVNDWSGFLKREYSM